MYFTEDLSNKISSYMAVKLNLDKDRQEIIAYGAFNMLQVLFSISLVIIFGAAFRVLVEALIISFSTAVLRKYSGGAHASSPGLCAAVGTAAAVGLALIIKHISSISLSMIITGGAISFLISFYIVYRLAPVDSINKPISDPVKKRRFKRASLITLCIFAAAALILLQFYRVYSSGYIADWILCIYAGILWQSFTLTSLGHKVLHKLG